MSGSPSSSTLRLPAHHGRFGPLANDGVLVPHPCAPDDVLGDALAVGVEDIDLTAQAAVLGVADAEFPLHDCAISGRRGPGPDRPRLRHVGDRLLVPTDEGVGALQLEAPARYMDVEDHVRVVQVPD